MVLSRERCSTTTRRITSTSCPAMLRRGCPKTSWRRNCEFGYRTHPDCHSTNLFFSNKVKGDCAKEREELLRFKSEPSTSTTIKRESLLKPQFRKPTSGHVQKKLAVKATVVTESRRPKAKQTADKPNTESITHSRLNLLRALTKVKTEQVDNKEGLDRYYTERCRATLAETGEDGRHVKYLRSDEDWSDKSSSYDGIDGEVDPLKGRRGRKRRSPQTHSEESSESDYKKKYPNLHIEPPPKTEYTQEEFLQYFKIITPQVAELLKLRRSERKRRNCTKNEKNDYHYGNFDLNEVNLFGSRDGSPMLTLSILLFRLPSEFV